MPSRDRRPAIALLTCSAALLACSAAPSGSEPSAGGAGATPSAGGSGGALDLGLGGGATGGGSPGPGCGVETQYVYTLTSANELLRFDPPTLAFQVVGILACQSFGATPYSMAVDRHANAYTVLTDGTLHQVDTKTAACTPTSFAPGQYGYSTFGMGFSSNAPGSAAETLFVSDSAAGSGGTQGLAKIDLATMTLTPIGAYDTLQARAELTGTGDARLIGAFEGFPYVVAEIDKASAHIVSQAPQTSVNYAPGSSNFAFAFWGGDFWLFVGPGSYTDVFQYKPSDGTTTLRTTVPYVIVGAGVSTCAPTTTPE